MDTVRRVFLSLFFIFIMPSALLADALDNELPNDTPLQIKEMAREVIRLGVQDHGVIKMTRTMLQNRFSEQQMIRAYEILGEAKRNGLSEKPVMDKLYEGIGKRVQTERIINAMETVRERYQTAGKLAHEMSGNREQAGILTSHIAESLSAGMTGSDISRIGGTLSNLKVKNNMERTSLQIQTFMTAKTMVRMGAGSASVAHTIQSALKNGYNQEKMKGLEKAFVVQARAKYNPSEIAKTFTRGIESGVSVEEMGRQGYMNSANNMGGNGFGSGFGSGSGAGGMGGSGGSGAGHGAGGGGGRR